MPPSPLGFRGLGQRCGPEQACAASSGAASRRWRKRGLCCSATFLFIGLPYLPAVGQDPAMPAPCASDPAGPACYRCQVLEQRQDCQERSAPQLQAPSGPEADPACVTGQPNTYDYIAATLRTEKDKTKAYQQTAMTFRQTLNRITRSTASPCQQVDGLRTTAEQLSAFQVAPSIATLTKAHYCAQTQIKFLLDTMPGSPIRQSVRADLAGYHLLDDQIKDLIESLDINNDQNNSYIAQLNEIAKSCSHLRNH